MRGAAALSVVVFHVYLFHIVAGGQSGSIAGVLNFGWIGVDFFFVLSGFLLALPLLAAPAQIGARGYWRGYLLRRWLRIAPPYYASIALALLVAGRLSLDREGLVDLGAHLLYVHTFAPDLFGSINSVYWTLGIEFQFYLLLPLLALAFSNRRWPLALAASLAVSVLWRAFAYDPAHGSWLTHQIPGFLGHFALGVAAARLRLDGWKPRFNPVALAAAGLLLLIALPLKVLTYDYAYVQGTETLAANVLLRPLLAAGFALLILLATTASGPLASAFASRPGRALGEASYSLYLVHLPVLQLVGRGLPSLPVGPFAAYLAVATVASLAAAFVFHALIERPSLRIKDWAASRTPRPATPAPILPVAATPNYI